MAGKWKCRKENSDYLDKKVWVPVRRIQGRTIRKLANVGEKEEYKTKLKCMKRISKLNKTLGVKK